MRNTTTVGKDGHIYVAGTMFMQTYNKLFEKLDLDPVKLQEHMEMSIEDNLMLKDIEISEEHKPLNSGDTEDTPF